MYMFLLHWLVITAETKVKPSGEKGEGEVAEAGKKKKAGKKKAAANAEEQWEWISQKERALRFIQELLELKLNRIWHMDSERDNFIRFACSFPSFLLALYLFLFFALLRKEFLAQMAISLDD